MAYNDAYNDDVSSTELRASWRKPVSEKKNEWGTDAWGASRALNYKWELSRNAPKLTETHYPGMCPNRQRRTIPECAQTDRDALSRNVPKLTETHYPGMCPNWQRRTIPECTQTDRDALSRNAPKLIETHYPGMCPNKYRRTIPECVWPTQQIDGNSQSRQLEFKTSVELEDIWRWIGVTNHSGEADF